MTKTPLGPSLISDAGGLSRWATREAQTADPRQIDRELIVNAAEAGATTLLLRRLEHRDRELYVAVDNGPGVVDPDRLRELVRTMHLTTKDVERNYGFGARLVSLARNPFGVTFASRQPASLVEGFDPRGIRDASTGRRRVVEFSVTVRPDSEGTYRLDTDADGETVFELDLPAFSYFNGTRFSETGYAVILHGDENESAWPGGHVLHRQIAHRFWRIPHGLDVRIEADGVQSARPLAQRLETAVRLGEVESGVVYLDEWPNVSVTWALLDEKQQRASSPRDALAHGVTAELDDELFGWDRTSSRFDQFGISHRSVRQRLLLVVHVPSATDDPAEGYVMSANRGRLDHLNARPGKEGITWAQYGAAFYEQMPDQIRDALRVRVSVSIGSGLDGVRDLFGDAALEELNRIVALTLDSEGDEIAGEDDGEPIVTGPTGEEGGGGGGGGGTTETTVTAKEGILRRARKRSVRPAPECEWVSPDELDDNEKAFLIRLVAGTEKSARPTLIGNRGHGWYERVAGVMAAEFPLVDRSTLLEAVEATLGAAAIWVYLAAARARREAVNGSGAVDSIDAFHSSEALTLGTMATSVPAVEPRLREMLLAAVHAINS
jgi:hypothetical protein